MDDRPPGQPPTPPPIVTQPTGLQCARCGYDLSGAAVAGRCPECGMDIVTSLRAHSRPISGKAIASMILGICSIAGGCLTYGFASLFCSPLAIILALLAQRDVRAGAVNVNSKGFAIAGLVTGIIGCVFALIFVTLIVLLFISILVGAP